MNGSRGRRGPRLLVFAQSLQGCRGPPPPFRMQNMRDLAVPLLLLLGACATAGRAQPDCQSCVPHGSRAGVRFQRDALIPGGDTTTVLTVVFDDGRQVRSTRSTEWAGEARNRWGPYFETATADSLRATGILQSAAGDTLAVGHVNLPVRPHWWWGVRWDVARVSTIRGLPGIHPESYSWYFPFRTDAGESDPRALYVRVGTRSISNPTPH